MPATRRQRKAMGTDAAAPPKTPPRRSSRRGRAPDEILSSAEPRDAGEEYNDDEEEEEEPETPVKSEAYIFDGVVYETYQEMVNAKRKRNEDVLKGLGFLDTGGAPRLKKEATQRGIKRKPKSATAAPLPRRKSSRLSSEKANLVALDYYVNDWNRNNSVVKLEGGDGDRDEEEEETQGFFKGRLNDGADMTLKHAIEFMDDKWIRDGSLERSEKFLRNDALKHSESSPSKTRRSPTSVVIPSRERDLDEKDLASMVGDLSIDNEEWVAKVTPDRIYSVAAHPSEDKLIACAGDKWGHVGIWDVDAPDSDETQHGGVHLFRVHSRPVCGLQWATRDSMISASYDGTIRRLHAERGTFEEIFASYDDSNSYYAEELGYGLDEGHRFWHQHVCLDHRAAGSADPSLFLATSMGTALHLDLRVSGKHRITFNAQLSEKKLNTLSLHPNGHTLASAGNDGLVNLWDVRKFKGGRRLSSPKAMATQQIGLSVSSSYFSPSGNSLLSTSFANRLDLVENAHKRKGTIKPTRSIPHNNQTGRWLSTFMACWHPTRDVFLSGSMKKPRCMEVFDGEGNLLRAITGDSLTAVASRCCFHPSTNKLILIGGNSSGRVTVIR